MSVLNLLFGIIVGLLVIAFPAALHHFLSRYG